MSSLEGNFIRSNIMWTRRLLILFCVVLTWIRFFSTFTKDLPFTTSGIWKKGVIHALSCNHMRAVDYFTISIRQCSFMAFSCSTWEMFKEGRCSNKNSTIVVSLMGYDAGNYTHVEGQMYLKTTSTSPFCGMSKVLPLGSSQVSV